MSKSNIEWTGETWNPLIGCDKVSAGCKNCYAINTAWIRQHNPKMLQKYDGVVEKTVSGALNWTGKVNMHEPALLQPLKNKKPTLYFVNSMSDLFHDDVPFSFITKVFDVMAQCPHHTFQILTKRDDRMKNYFSFQPEKGAVPLPNVWLGVSVENEAAARLRIPSLINTPAAVRFISAEPLLGYIDISPYVLRSNAEHLPFRNQPEQSRLKRINLIDWVICGGESGFGSRPMNPEWARSLRDQCEIAGIPFFFKQWGNWVPATPEHRWDGEKLGFFFNGRWFQRDPADHQCYEGYQFMQNVGKGKAGRTLDGIIHDHLPTIGTML